MKLGSLRSAGADGTLIVVDQALSRYIPVPEIAPTLQYAIERWDEVAPALRDVYARINEDRLDGLSLDMNALRAPLPRAYQWLDGSAYLSHVERVRKARGAAMPANSDSEPLMYQGHSAHCAGPRDPISVSDEAWGIDFEAEVVVVTERVPQRIATDVAAAHILLLMLGNDVSYRNLIPAELAKGFGFLHAKPGCAFSPVAVTPDELGPAWDGSRLSLPLLTDWNGSAFGRPNAGIDMQFGFPALISHAAKTRALAAGTMIGSGTVSNRDTAVGFSCIVEKRMQEILETGTAQTPYMRFGDRVRINMLDQTDRPIFGTIEQVVVACQN
jgi:fumarylacetoacetate (FAA) hydrolase